jgi:hypothetical protein
LAKFYRFFDQFGQAVGVLDSRRLETAKRLTVSAGCGKDRPGVRVRGADQHVIGFDAGCLLDALPGTVRNSSVDFDQIKRDKRDAIGAALDHESPCKQRVEHTVSPAFMIIASQRQAERAG